MTSEVRMPTDSTSTSSTSSSISNSNLRSRTNLSGKPAGQRESGTVKKNVSSSGTTDQPPTPARVATAQDAKPAKPRSLFRRVLKNLFFVFLLYLVLKVYVVGEKKRAEWWEKRRVVHSSR